MAAVEPLPFVGRIPNAPVSREGSRQDALYDEFGTVLAGAVERLARGYESNQARRQLYTRAASLPVPGGDGETGVIESCLRFHRRELERQRDLLGSVWRWYLGPLVPGVIVMFLDRLIAAWGKGGFAIVASLGSALVTALVFIGVFGLNAAAARKLQHEIDALDAGTTGEKP